MLNNIPVCTRDTPFEVRRLLEKCLRFPGESVGYYEKGVPVTVTLTSVRTGLRTIAKHYP